MKDALMLRYDINAAINAATGNTMSESVHLPQCGHNSGANMTFRETFAARTFRETFAARDELRQYGRC